MYRLELEQTARAMTAPGKGILAVDESSPTIRKRFAAAGIDCTEDTRRAYRELLFTAEGLGYLIGGSSFSTRPSGSAHGTAHR